MTELKSIANHARKLADMLDNPEPDNAAWCRVAEMRIDIIGGFDYPFRHANQTAGDLHSLARRLKSALESVERVMRDRENEAVE